MVSMVAGEYIKLPSQERELTDAALIFLGIEFRHTFFQASHIHAYVADTLGGIVHFHFQDTDMAIVFLQSLVNVILCKVYRVDDESVCDTGLSSFTLNSSIRTKSGKKGRTSSIFRMLLCFKSSMTLYQRERDKGEYAVPTGGMEVLRFNVLLFLDDIFRNGQPELFGDFIVAKRFVSMDSGKVNITNLNRNKSQSQQPFFYYARLPGVQGARLLRIDPSDYKGGYSFVFAQIGYRVAMHNRDCSTFHGPAINKVKSIVKRKT